MAENSPTVSFEFFPPTSSEAGLALKERLKVFAKLSPSFVSVTYGAGGSTRDRTHDLVVSLQDSGDLDPVPHLTCVQHSTKDIDEILQRYAEHGISNLLALRGDEPQKDSSVTGDFVHAIDLVRHIKTFNDSGIHPDDRGFGIGVAGFPEGHPETPNQLRHMDHLREKVDVGADWITTQLFTDNSHFFDWRDRCDLAGIEVPIVAGVMPITSLRTMERMSDLAAGTTFPARLQRSLLRYRDDPASLQQVGVQWAVDQCNELLDHHVAGLHFYTLNRSDATEQIFEALGAKTSGDLQSMRDP